MCEFSFKMQLLPNRKQYVYQQRTQYHQSFVNSTGFWVQDRQGVNFFLTIRGWSAAVGDKECGSLAEKSEIWIMDDHPFRRAAYHALFLQDAESDNIVVKSCGTTLTERLQTRPTRNSLILLVLGGYNLSDDAARRVLSNVQQANAAVPIAIMLDTITGADIDFALMMGLKGLICTKDEMPLGLAAIRFLLAGGIYIPHDHAYNTGCEIVELETVNNAVAAAVTVSKDQSLVISDPVMALTRRQEEVFAVLASGASNKIIARTLSLSEATVKIHVRNIFQKLSVNNRVQAALYARNSMTE